MATLNTKAMVIVHSKNFGAVSFNFPDAKGGYVGTVSTFVDGGRNLKGEFVGYSYPLQPRVYCHDITKTMPLAPHLCIPHIFLYGGYLYGTFDLLFLGHALSSPLNCQKCNISLQPHRFFREA
jgi:hypothetical protein